MGRRELRLPVWRCAAYLLQSATKHTRHIRRRFHFREAAVNEISLLPFAPIFSRVKNGNHSVAIWLTTEGVAIVRRIPASKLDIGQIGLPITRFRCPS